MKEQWYAYGYSKIEQVDSPVLVNRKALKRRGCRAGKTEIKPIEEATMLKMTCW